MSHKRAAPEFDMHVDPFIPTPGVELGDPPTPNGLPIPPNPPNPNCVGCTPLLLSDPPTVVPEPSTWLLVATGLGAGVAQLVRKRRQSKQ